MIMRLKARLLCVLGIVASVVTMAATPKTANADSDVDAHVWESNTTCLSPAVPLVGGVGTFCISSTICINFSSDDVPPVGGCHMTASGTYTNTVCGTGSASGSASLTEDGFGGETVSFGVVLIAGVGVVTGGADGVVVLVPTGTGAPANCATGFAVTGADVLG